MLKKLWRKIMELITGRTGVQHVKAIDDAEIYKSIFGENDYVLQTGAQLNATMTGTSQVNIANGTAIMQGRQVKIRPADGFESLPIDVGTVGYKRWDVVCIEYNIQDGIESAELVVIKGSPSESWTEPTIQYEDGDIDSGETHRMKLWGVKLDGINFSGFVDYRQMFKKRIDDENIFSIYYDIASNPTVGAIDYELTAEELAEINERIDGEYFSIVGFSQWENAGSQGYINTHYQTARVVATSPQYHDERVYPYIIINQSENSMEIERVIIGVYASSNSTTRIGAMLTLRLEIDG